MRNSPSLFFGLLLITFGAIFLLDNLGYVNSEYIFENFWPLILVFIGVSILVRKSRTPVPADPQSGAAGSGRPMVESSADYFSRSAVFGDVDANISSKSFTGGSSSVVFGQIDIDLSQAQLSVGSWSLRLNSVFGSARVTIPRGMEFAVNASLVAGEVRMNDNKRGGLFGTSRYQTDGYDAADRKLIIVASSIFGNIKILQGVSAI